MIATLFSSLMILSQSRPCMGCSMQGRSIEVMLVPKATAVSGVALGGRYFV